jgi:hypothetical protein
MCLKTAVNRVCLTAERIYRIAGFQSQSKQRQQIRKHGEGSQKP